MKKMICLVLAMMVCLMWATPAFAAEDDFVPSISYKDSPDVEDAVLGEEGEEVDDCVIVTSIAQAIAQSTDIHQESRDLLLDIYEQLKNDMMELELAENYIVRELVDVSFKKTECVEDEEHLHEDQLLQPGVTMAISFNLGVRPNTNVVILNFYDGSWHTVPSTNNGDGTVTGVFDHFSPVAFCVDADDEVAPPATGDLALGEVAMWGTLLMVSGLMLVILLMKRRQESR